MPVRQTAGDLDLVAPYWFGANVYGVDLSRRRNVEDIGKRDGNDGDIDHRRAWGDGARQHAVKYKHV